MKNKFLFLFTIVLLTMTACQDTINVEQEEQAIIAVIDEETNAYRDRDLERFKSSYLQDETTKWLGVGREGFWYISGWNDLNKYFDEDFQRFPEPLTFKFEKTNYQVKVYPTSAWAIFEERMFNDAGEMIWKGLGVRFLEKSGGRWKINYVSTTNTKSFEDAEALPEGDSLTGNTD